MNTDEKRTLAYLCPACHQSVAAERTVFALAAAADSVPCPCGHSELHYDLTGTQARLEVPCLFCQKEHTVTCPTQALLREKALAFSCGTSGLDCCYVGQEDAVFAALARLEPAADKLETARATDSPFLDATVMEEIMAEVKDIAANGGVSCDCGSTKWSMKVHFSSADLICADCGAALRIPAATEDDLADLCCKSVLRIHGKRV